MTGSEIGEFAAKHWLTVAFGLVVTGLTAAYRRLAKKIKRNQAEQKAVQNGVKALLEDRMIQLHAHNQERGYCPVYAKRSAEAMYEAYHDLGGNGTITKLYEALLAMPTESKEGA